MDYRKKANRVLGAVFILFAAAAAFKYQYPHNQAANILNYVFDAALIGGIADWFAVTALFRKPLGFPWHTALIPRNRQKLIETISSAVQNEFLCKDSLKRRIADVQIIGFAIQWLDTGDNQLKLQETAARHIQNVLNGLEPREIVHYGQKMLKAYLREATLTDKLTQFLEWGLAEGRADYIYDSILDWLTAAVGKDSARQTIQKYLEQAKENAAQTWWQKFVLNIAESTDMLNVEDGAAVLHRELGQLLRDVKDAGHPIRRWIQSRLIVAVDNLGDNPEWRKNVAEWQSGLADRLDLEEALAALVELVLTRATPSEAAAWANSQFSRLLDRLRSDRLLQERLEERLKIALGELIDIEHNLVETVAKEALQRLSDNDLNRFIEEKVGEDLAWIRINGSVVGGIVGLFLYFFLYYFYSPFAVPIIRAWVNF